MDYKLLLEKYIALIFEAEGIDYLGHIRDPFIGHGITFDFSNDEISALKEISFTAHELWRKCDAKIR